MLLAACHTGRVRARRAVYVLLARSLLIARARRVTSIRYTVYRSILIRLRLLRGTNSKC